MIKSVKENGIAHGGDEAIAAAKASLLSEVPHLQATVSTSLAAAVAEQMHQHALQDATALEKPE